MWPIVMNLGLQNRCKKGKIILTGHVIINIPASIFPSTSLPASRHIKVFAFAACAEQLQNVSQFSQVSVHVPRLRWPILSALHKGASAHSKRFQDCTFQIIVYLLLHLWYSVSVSNVEGCLWTRSSWPSLGAKISLFLYPSRDPVGAVLTTCLKTRWLEGLKSVFILLFITLNLFSSI